jgi:predicted heme/steroid binding protein
VALRLFAILYILVHHNALHEFELPSEIYFAMYTLEEVQKHNNADDVWIVLHNKVYDITKYLEDHPGGSAILIEVAGTDATEAFEETGHSDEAREELEKYQIGDLPTEVRDICHLILSDFIKLISLLRNTPSPSRSTARPLNKLPRQQQST